MATNHVPAVSEARGAVRGSGNDDGPAVRVRGLIKSYGGAPAVRGVDLDIRQGEIFALLGPNGAGKTTTVEILEGYRTRDGGEVSVLGLDPGARPGSAEAADRHRAAVDRRRAATSPCARPSSMYAGVLPRPRPRRRGDRPRRAHGEAGRARRAPVRRPAAPPRHGRRPRRRPRAAVPRRAHHRLRPVGPPRRVGDREGPRRARQDGACSPPTTWTRRSTSPTGSR